MKVYRYMKNKSILMKNNYKMTQIRIQMKNNQYLKNKSIQMKNNKFYMMKEIMRRNNKKSSYNNQRIVKIQMIEMMQFLMKKNFKFGLIHLEVKRIFIVQIIQVKKRN